MSLAFYNTPEKVGGGGHFLCLAVRDARLYMGYFKFSVPFPRDGYLFSTKFLFFLLQGGYLF